MNSKALPNNTAKNQGMMKDVKGRELQKKSSTIYLPMRAMVFLFNLVSEAGRNALTREREEIVNNPWNKGGNERKMNRRRKIELQGSDNRVSHRTRRFVIYSIDLHLHNKPRSHKCILEMRTLPTHSRSDLGRITFQPPASVPFHVVPCEDH